jgi:hypothetical protein
LARKAQDIIAHSVDAIRLTVATAGLGLLSYGAWLHYHPLGFIVPGTALFAVAVAGALRAK